MNSPIRFYGGHGSTRRVIPCCRGARCGFWPPRWRGAWPGSGDPERPARGVLLFRDCRIRGAWRPVDDVSARGHDVRPRACDALRSALPFYFSLNRFGSAEGGRHLQIPVAASFCLYPVRKWKRPQYSKTCNSEGGIWVFVNGALRADDWGTTRENTWRKTRVEKCGGRRYRERCDA